MVNKVYTVFQTTSSSPFYVYLVAPSTAVYQTTQTVFASSPEKLYISTSP
uniref:Uncharacterized protein n=1 Tax=Rhizophora mucronata TaxID=61149 RepID=A0A2P2QHH0_RHIMU